MEPTPRLPSRLRHYEQRILTKRSSVVRHGSREQGAACRFGRPSEGIANDASFLDCLAIAPGGLRERANSPTAPMKDREPDQLRSNHLRRLLA